MALIVDKVRQGAGNFVDALGSVFAPWAPDTNISELIAGGPTLNTQAKASTAYPTTPVNTTQQNQSPAPVQGSGYGANYASNPGNYSPTTTGGGGNQGGSQGGGGVNLKDPYANPGAGYFWDAADGWKPTGGGDAQAEVRRREEEARGAINSGYGQYEQNLRGLQGTYETSRDQELNSASKIYEQIFGGLGEQRQTNLEKLEAGRGQVTSRQDASIKGLQQNLLNTQRGMTMQLGALGAGDTSATQTMMPYAYNKIAGQQESGIRLQANQQLFEIDNQQRDTELQFSQMQRQTEVEKEQSLQGIRNYYGEAIQRVQTALAQAPLDKQRDLSALSQSLLSEAMSNLRNLESQYVQRQNQIKDWAVTRMSELNNARLQLAGTANFSPRDITYQELQMLNAPTATGVGTGTEFWNPMAAAKKVRDEYMGS